MTKFFKKWLIVCFVSMLLIYCFHRFISQQIDFVACLKGYLKIQDYAYHIILVKAFWFDGFGNIYDVYFQQQALSSYIGSQINKVMPLGITPIALVVWFPFAYVARFNMALSYTLWVAFSIGILFTALWRIGRYVFKNKKPQLLPIALSLIAVCSVTTVATILLGQTSLLAIGLLIHLIFYSYKVANQSKSANLVPILLLIFILGIKPPYIVLGLGLLIIYGMWREAFYSLALVIFVFIGITPILTTEWVHSYLNLLQMYSRGNIPDVYACSIVPITMNIFRSAFKNFIGDNIASLISNVVTYSVYIVVVGFCLLSKIKGKSIDQLSLLRVTKAQLFIVLIASYLLFAPYANFCEDLLLICVFAMVLLYGDTPRLTNYKSLVLIIIFFPIILHRFFPPDKSLWLFWILKAIMLGYIFKFCRFPPEGKKSVT